MPIRGGGADTYKAWMTPGNQPRMVKQMLIKRSAPHPRSRKTPRGGRMMAKMILQMSLRLELALERQGERDQVDLTLDEKTTEECHG